MPRRRALVPQKRLVFLACEGQGEEGYGRWLNRLAGDYGVPVAIRAESLGGGDPFALVEKALERLARTERYRGRYAVRWLLLDADRLGEDPGRDAQAQALAKRKGFRLLWQEPVHEAFLLRHFAGLETRRPPDRPRAEALLQKVWPDYYKGMDAIGYGAVLKLDRLFRGRKAEEGLNALLRAMGWR